MVIDHIEHPERFTVGQGVLHEIGAPCDIAVNGQYMRALHPDRQPPLSLSPDIEPHGDIYPIDPFVVPDPAHCPEHVEHLLEAIGGVFPSKSVQ